MYTDEQIARCCHAALREFAIISGEEDMPDWTLLADDLRQLNIDGVAVIRQDPSRTAEDCHREWMQNKLVDGWTYGEEKDEDAKTNPSLVDYSQLPLVERMKNEIFRVVCLAMLNTNPV